jgi:hypothetical protein
MVSGRSNWLIHLGVFLHFLGGRDMRRASGCAIVLLLFLGIESMAAETIRLSLAPTSPDPLVLQVGIPLSVHVQLAGITGTGRELDTLIAGVTYPSNLLTVDPLSVKKGLIVPTAESKPFASSATAGYVDGTFMTFSTSPSTNPEYHVRNDGVFFSFLAQGVTPGTGVLHLSLKSAWEQTLEGSNELTLPASADLSFKVIYAPEPSGFVLLAVAAATLCLLRKVSFTRP